MGWVMSYPVAAVVDELRATAAEVEATEVAEVMVAARAITEPPPPDGMIDPMLVKDPANDPELLLGVLSKLFNPVRRPV